MAILPVTLTVGDAAYDVGTIEALAPDDTQRGKLAPFLQALADTLNDGYTLRRKMRPSGEPAEIADLPVEVRQLVHAVDSLRDQWAEASDARRQELWQTVHRANDAVWSRTDQG
ncbi:hypothetical protein ACIBG4_40690 [Nonomuraea sp. NPDC050383]|uniref:hypothetical protein n=1 Tax=Nonomuraea sp. NPDC050383 TaxID=3364362 RepID=UPI00379EA62A